mgnify:CR=1 FL=1
MSNHRCIIDDFGGEKHPYGYCVKPLDQMIDYGKIRRDSNGGNMVGISEGAQGIVNYATALVSNPQNAIANECGGKLGNRYVLKSKMKCKNMDENVHVYINNVADYNFLTQRKDPNIGIIPATVGSALQINGLPLIRALYEDPKQECIKTTIPCHLVDKKNPNNSYSGDVDNVPITVRQYDELVENNQINPTKEQRDFRESLNNEANTDKFTNLHESIYSYLDENPQLFNIKNDALPIKELDNSNNDLLFDFYYLLLSIFFLFLLFKIMNKK